MGKIIKSIIFIVFILIWIINFSNNTSFANNETTFIVTAYYSPLPNQKNYTTWSYAGDIRLNWKGHTTASWKPVSPWILAAPNKYPFWTKIYFDWYWIGTVEDRWWAIVKAWKRGYEHDRIDIWVWYGDEGLMRALKWWKRTINWKVVARSSGVTLEFSENVLEDIEDITVNPDVNNSNDVKKLQKNFQKLSLYNWSIDWKYGSIKESLINFQVQNKVISSKNHVSAWWFWPKTYLKLLKKYWNDDILLKKEIKVFKETNEKVKTILDHEEIKLNWDEPQEVEVIKVQELLKKLWMYNWEIDGNFNSIRRILLDFQKEAWIIKKDDGWWAWYFWEKTKAALITHFENNYNKEDYEKEDLNLKNNNKEEINRQEKKRITIDDISYSTLNNIWKKLRNSPNSEELIKKLKKVKKVLKSSTQIKKIEYLIDILD